MLNPRDVRKRVLELAYHGQTAHIGCALSIVDMVCFVLNNYPDDELVLSKGHGVMALYAAWNLLGKITDADLANYGKPGSKFLSLCETPFITGSMGHGLPIAAGIAYGLKRDKSKKRVFCIVGDGEMQEGSMWEAAQFIAREKLHNLTILVDANGFQAMGRTENPYLLLDKLVGFGLTASVIDGHDMSQMKNFMCYPELNQVMVCETLKGCGVSFMENENEWHYRRLTREELERALKELAA